MKKTTHHGNSNILRSSPQQPTDPRCYQNRCFLTAISNGCATRICSDDEKKDTDNNKGDIDALVTHQKERAIQYWTESKSKHTEALKDQVHDDVMQHLQEGKVLPIFHTLCRPPTERLFSPDTRVSVNDPTSDIIQLSSDPVTMGECVEESELVGKLSMKEERSYMTSFFNNGAANFIVEDKSFRWEFDEDYTKYVTDLVNAPADMVGEDIEVTKLSKPIAVDKKSGRNLITRRLSRGVVADCFNKLELGSTYAIVGNPGIGKSWTLLYALQQALLYENVCVLFCMQKDGIAMVCLRKNNQIIVWQSTDDRWLQGCSSNLFYNSNVLVLLDPKESKEGGARFAQGWRMLLMAASNNANHFGATEKFTPLFARFLSLLSNKELKVCLPLMVENGELHSSIDEILKRASIVGNLPRYIISEQSFQTRVKRTLSSIKKLEKEEIQLILNTNGLNENDGIVHGCIFSVNVKISTDKNYDNAIDDIAEREAGSGNESISVGYDGQHVLDYGDVDVNILSKMVLGEIVNLSRKHILSFWGITSSGKRSEMAEIVENLFWEDLKKRYQRRIIPMKKYNDEPAKESYLSIGDCEYIEGVRLDELTKKVFNNLNVIARMKDRELLLDSAGPGLCLYQITISDDHGLVESGLEKLFVELGYGQIIDGAFQRVPVTNSGENADDEKRRISLFWVIPKDREGHWRKKAPKKVQSNAHIAYCLEKYVVQYLLVMDEVPIEHDNTDSRFISTASNETVVVSHSESELKFFFTKDNLKNLCRKYKVKISGNKSVLAKRLLPFAESILPVAKEKSS